MHNWIARFSERNFAPFLGKVVELKGEGMAGAEKGQNAIPSTEVGGIPGGGAVEIRGASEVRPGLVAGTSARGTMGREVCLRSDAFLHKDFSDLGARRRRLSLLSFTLREDFSSTDQDLACAPRGVEVPVFTWEKDRTKF